MELLYICAIRYVYIMENKISKTDRGFADYELENITKLLKKCKKEKDILKVEDITEICRMYSSEIEYSEENLNELMILLRQ